MSFSFFILDAEIFGATVENVSLATCPKRQGKIKQKWNARKTISIFDGLQFPFHTNINNFARERKIELSSPPGSFRNVAHYSGEGW